MTGPAAEEMDQQEERGYVREGAITLPPVPAPACTFDANRPRLVITHIENTDFKSFAGLQVWFLSALGY